MPEPTKHKSFQNTLEIPYKSPLSKVRKNPPHLREKLQHFAHTNINPTNKFRPRLETVKRRFPIARGRFRGSNHAHRDLQFEELFQTKYEKL